MPLVRHGSNVARYKAVNMNPKCVTSITAVQDRQPILHCKFGKELWASARMRGAVPLVPTGLEGTWEFRRWIFVKGPEELLGRDSGKKKLSGFSKILRKLFFSRTDRSFLVATTRELVLIYGPLSHSCRCSDERVTTGRRADRVHPTPCIRFSDLAKFPDENR